MDPAVHNRVRQLRQARNWTQEQLATEAGVSRQSMNSIERGRYIPSLPLALMLAQVFGCPVERLFSLSAFPEPSPESTLEIAADPDEKNHHPQPSPLSENDA